MHISIEKSKFVKVLSHCQNVVEKKSTLPILSSIMLQAQNGHLSIAATDMDMELVLSMPVEVISPGATCVSAGLLHDIVKKLREKAVINLELIEEGSRLLLTSGRSRFELGCLPVEDFPKLTAIELSHEFSLPIPILEELIETTRPFVSTEETRYNMSGIFFHCVGDQQQQFLRAVASDMHRLACVQCVAPKGAIDMPGAIIARKTVNEVLKLMEDSQVPVAMGLSQSRVEFKVDCSAYTATLTARLVDAIFPEYTEALHVPDDKKLIVNTKEFAEAIERVGSVLVSSDKIRAIRLKATPEIATLSAVHQSAGSGVEDFDVSFSSQTPVEVCCNIKYILDVAQQIKTEEMEMLLQDEHSSILMKPAGEDNHHMVFILMPMDL